MLVNPGDFANIVQTLKSRSAGAKINVAIVGAGDFYFDAKKYFSK